MNFLLSFIQKCSILFLLSSTDAENALDWKRVEKIEKGAASRQFGFDTCMNHNGTVIAIASLQLNTSTEDLYSGIVSVYFESNEGLWSQLGADIVLSSETIAWTGDGVVSLNEDGDILAIGTSYEILDKGQVRLMQYNDASDIWITKGQIIDGTVDGERFGASVELSADGNVLAIGSPFYSESEEMIMVGRVSVWNYIEDTDEWDLSFDIVGEAAFDESGLSIALSSNSSRLAIGAMGNNGSSHDAGHIRVYDIDSHKKIWNKIGSDIDGESALDWFGSTAISSDGEIVAVGAKGSDGQEGNIFMNKGHVQIYQLTEEYGWAKIWFEIQGENRNDFSGGKLDLNNDGSRLIIGAESNDGDGTQVDAGHARVFDLTQNGWVQLGFDINGENSVNLFGSSVCINDNGTRILVGAPRYGKDANGAIYIYDLKEKSLLADPPINPPDRSPPTSSGFSPFEVAKKTAFLNVASIFFLLLLPFNVL